MSRFSVEIFMSHSAEKFRKGILLFFRMSLVSESFMDGKRGMSRSSVEVFWSHSAEKFRWGRLRCIGKFRLSKIFMHQREGGYHVSPSKTFVTLYRKTSLGNSSVFQKISCIANFYAYEGDITKLLEKFLSHSADKIRRRTLLCFERILVSKLSKQRRGEASRFCRKIFYLTGPKNLRQGTILCFRKSLVGKKFLWIRDGGGGGEVSQFSVEKFFSHCTKIFHW